MGKISKIVICVLIICGLANFASAGMWWTRGTAGSTYQEWTFDTDDVTTSPNPYPASLNPYGAASAMVTLIDTGSYPEGWNPVGGIWFGDVLEVTLTIPNNPVTNYYKEIWVTAICRGHFDGIVYETLKGGALGTGYDVISPSGTGVIVQDLGFVFVNLDPEIGLRELTFGLRIYPNPNVETISFKLLDSGAWLDSVTVDTICIPEPATLAVLGFGAAMSLMCRKKG